MAVHHNEASGHYATSIPKPTIGHLGKGSEVQRITYSVKGRRTEVSAAGKGQTRKRRVLNRL